MSSKSFNYITLKKEIDFPNSSEVNIIRTDNEGILYEIIFQYNGAWYKVDDVYLPISNHNDFNNYFQVTKGGNVIATNVVKIEIMSHEWRAPSLEALFDQALFSKEVEKIEKDLSLLSMSELGSLENKYGQKHKNKTIKEVYDSDVNFIEWLRKNPPEYTVLNKYVLQKEKSRLALLLYYDSKDYLSGQGK